MTNNFFKALVLVGLMAGANGTAEAATFEFDFSGGGISVIGMLSAIPNGNGTFTATSGTAMQSGDPNVGSSLTLVANPDAPSEIASTIPQPPSLGFGSDFNYDDQLLLGQKLLLSTGGLLFTDINGYGVNLFAQPNYRYLSYNSMTQGYAYESGTFTVSIPELSTWAMLMVGAAGLGYAGRSRSKRQRLAALLALGRGQ
jgi:hypothetical protein